MRDLFILGAGFSANAGLPIQSEFTRRLISAGTETSKDDPTRAVLPFLRDFISQAFGHLQSAKAEYWPDLEDIFTCIDLSANTGHNLGRQFAPAELRTVRRALITRIVAMLRCEYDKALSAPPREWGGLETFFANVNVKDCAFVNLNWDSVVEERVSDLHGPIDLDYGCGAKAALFGKKLEIALATERPQQKLLITKMHGSVNWLYCDCCRRVFWFPPKRSMEIARQILKAKEWDKIDDGFWHTESTCCYCQGAVLGTRLATFTYLKALDSPMFQKSWFSADRLLRSAKRWIFIGYSLPGADYEFKYLLKRVQLSRKIPPEIIIITKGRRSALTYSNYQRFFGLVVKKPNFFPYGLSKPALERVFG